MIIINQVLNSKVVSGRPRKESMDYYLKTYGITKKEYLEYLQMVELDYTWRKTKITLGVKTNAQEI